MATTYDFTNGSIKGQITPPAISLNANGLQIRRNIIDCSFQTLDAGLSDVAQVLDIPAGTTVFDAWVRIITAETANATVDLGYGGDVDYWGNALPLDSTVKIIPTITRTAVTWNPGSIGDGNEEVKEVTVDGAALLDVVSVAAPIDVTDLSVVGQVTAANTVTIQLGNWTGGALDLASASWVVYVDKAPLRKQPLYFASADTIDLVATTDTADVNIDAAKLEICALCLKSLDTY